MVTRGCIGRRVSHPTSLATTPNHSRHTTRIEVSPHDALHLRLLRVFDPPPCEFHCRWSLVDDKDGPQRQGRSPHPHTHVAWTALVFPALCAHVLSPLPVRSPSRSQSTTMGLARSRTWSPFPALRCPPHPFSSRHRAPRALWCRELTCWSPRGNVPCPVSRAPFHYINGQVLWDNDVWQGGLVRCDPRIRRGRERWQCQRQALL